MDVTILQSILNVSPLGVAGLSLIVTIFILKNQNILKNNYNHELSNTLNRIENTLNTKLDSLRECMEEIETGIAVLNTKINGRKR